MNERIKELMKKAMVKTADMSRPGRKELDPEKFAELIIRQFIEQGKLIQSQTVVCGSEEYIAGREMGIEVFMNQVREHFGVKE